MIVLVAGSSAIVAAVSVEQVFPGVPVERVGQHVEIAAVGRRAHAADLAEEPGGRLGVQAQARMTEDVREEERRFAVERRVAPHLQAHGVEVLSASHVLIGEP